MKYIKIRIIIILLLIIFFGLLILFGSRNIYEGVTTGKLQKKEEVKECITKGCPDDLVDKYNKNFTTGAVIKKSMGKGEYFINVYYAHPDISTSITNLYNITSMPIVYLYHNLPNDFKVYFTNTDNFGNLAGTRIYIQKTGETDINKVKPKNIYLQYAVNSGKGDGLNAWKAAQKYSETKIVNEKFINELSTDKPNVTGKNVNGDPNNTDKTIPKATDELLPIKYDKIIDVKDGKAVWFQGEFGIIGKDFPLPVKNDTGRTNDGLGFLNLVTYYFELPLK